MRPHRVGAIRSHRYSAASFVLSLTNIYVSFVVMSSWYWGAPFDNYRSGPQGTVAWFPLILGPASVALAAVALGREKVKRPAFGAMAIGVATFILCFMRHAV